MPSRRDVLAALSSAALGAACRAVAPERPAADLDDIAGRYVRATLQLALHQPALVETYVAPERVAVGPRIPVAAIRTEIDRLIADLAVIAAQSPRRQYLEGQLKGLLTAARRLAGESMRFADEARDAFGIDAAAAIDSDRIHAARRSLESLLQGRGPLPDRYAEFRRRHALPELNILPLFRAAVDRCRERVAARVALPDGERVDVDSAADAEVEAQATYAGAWRTRISVAGGPTDVARLVWLAAHEAYPGHHLQHVLADRDLVARGEVERHLHPGFGAHLLIAEGAAEAGAQLLLDGDGFQAIAERIAHASGTSNEALTEQMAVHRAMTDVAAAIPPIAAAYLDGAIGTDEAARRLGDEALVPRPATLLGVVERQRTRLVAYPAGRLLVASALARTAPADERWQRLAAIATTLTVSSRQP
jgi:hypothetical protein